MPSKQRKNKLVTDSSQPVAKDLDSSGARSTGKARIMAEPSPCAITFTSQVEQMLGLRFSDISSFESFLSLCHKPTDASCLAIFRIMFGK